MRRHASPRRQAGLSLVELMISIALGLMVLAGVTTIFVSNSNTRTELEKTSRQIENGRYAMQLLSDDLQMAGFLGSYYDSTATAPASLPDPCATSTASISAAMLLHVQGYDNAASIPTCLSDVKSGTDILVIRRASSCLVGATDCEAFQAGAPHLQVSGCSTDASSYRLDTVQANFTLRNTACSATTGIRRFRTHIYFIANNNLGSDGVPTLKRAELGSAMTIVPMVEGIENLQLEYGLDTTGNDGVADVYTADPGSYNSCSGSACVTNWWNVMAVKINLLARNTQSTPGFTDAKTYTLGLKADGTANTYTPGGAYKRHAYAATVRLPNPAGRRQ